MLKPPCAWQVEAYKFRTSENMLCKRVYGLNDTVTWGHRFVPIVRRCSGRFQNRPTVAWQQFHDTAAVQQGPSTESGGLQRLPCRCMSLLWPSSQLADLCTPPEHQEDSIVLTIVRQHSHAAVAMQPGTTWCNALDSHLLSEHHGDGSSNPDLTMMHSHLYQSTSCSCSTRAASQRLQIAQLTPCGGCAEIPSRGTSTPTSRPGSPTTNARSSDRPVSPFGSAEDLGRAYEAQDSGGRSRQNAWGSRQNSGLPGQLPSAPSREAGDNEATLSNTTVSSPGHEWTQRRSLFSLPFYDNQVGCLLRLCLRRWSDGWSEVCLVAEESIYRMFGWLLYCLVADAGHGLAFLLCACRLPLSW